MIFMSTKTIDQRIIKTEGVCGGKPRIAGHRITVQNIVIWHDRLDWSTDEIADEYNLELADIHTALSYYFAHQKEVNRTIEKGEAFIKELRKNTSSLLQQKLIDRTCDR